MGAGNSHPQPQLPAWHRQSISWHRRGEARDRRQWTGRGRGHKGRDPAGEGAMQMLSPSAINKSSQLGHSRRCHPSGGTGTVGGRSTPNRGGCCLTPQGRRQRGPKAQSLRSQSAGGQTQRGALSGCAPRPGGTLGDPVALSGFSEPKYSAWTLPSGLRGPFTALLSTLRFFGGGELRCSDWGTPPRLRWGDGNPG